VIETCVFCANDARPQTEWTLPEPIVWRSTFTAAGEEPPFPAGTYTSCPTCTRWVPKHRTGALPGAVLQAIHAVVVDMAPDVRRVLQGELVGRWRHLASQLRPVEAVQGVGT
jgi:hypothetical protein